MNFFAAQARARRNTGLLIFLFLLAVGGIFLLANWLYLSVTAYQQTGIIVFSPSALLQYFSWKAFFAVIVVVSLFIVGGSFYKTLSLRKGGEAVAEMLGGRLVLQNTTDADEKRLLNVVEEMSIAAGMPIPRVYLLDDVSINAFAAGLTPATAVIGITRGSLNVLARDELQAVIAHEFSHILNGDMRLNIRLIGLLHGILLIGIVGYFLLRSLRFARRSKNSKGGSALVVLLLVGAGLMIIGYSGTFFGQWIKAVLSRQREYLADASAVQFTRNREGIAGALKKIAGSGLGSSIESPAAAEYSHAYFANGMSSFWQSMFATHPPLDRRIRSIDPGWDGKYISRAKPDSDVGSGDTPVSKPAVSEKIALAAVVFSAAEQAVTQIGTLNEANIDYVRQLITEIPERLRAAAQQAYSARAVVYLLLIREQKNKSTAWALLDKLADRNMAALTLKLDADSDQLDTRFKLPLLDLCINALRDLSFNQYSQFKECVEQIILADNKIALNEWVLQRFVLQQLDQHFGTRKPLRLKYTNLFEVNNALETILSLIAHVEHAADGRAELAFIEGKKSLGAEGFQILSIESLTISGLNQALDQLMQLRPLAKPFLLKAMAAVILADGRVTPKGLELIRMISSCLDCPMPPMQVPGNTTGTQLS